MQGVRAPNGLKGKVTGLGIGLPIARNIVRAHGGELSCVRHETGAEFIISLPMLLSQQEKPELEPNTKYMKIL